ncbi:MAG: OmpH family outer membrane protein [Flavobacteriales bacterium]|nr:OmpH family outer membrane protein [Flavobacteriales bacterium]MCB9449475.1 OmpH family outer membrane protein [Flavobacteriales bacterium]
MKKLQILFVALLFTAIGTQVQAQDKAQKIGHINSQELLSMMPEAKQAEDQLTKHAKELEDQLNTMQTEYQAKVDKFRQPDPFQTDAIRKTKEAEIMDLGKRIQEFEMSAQQSYNEMSAKVQQPLLEKVQKAIADVAKENGFTYILDTSAGNVLYFDGGIDVLPMVKKKLSIN